MVVFAALLYFFIIAIFYAIVATIALVQHLIKEMIDFGDTTGGKQINCSPDIRLNDLKRH